MQSALAHLQDHQIISNLERLSTVERSATKDVVLHLAEMYGRRIYLVLAYSSLFDYVTRGLGYSSSAAMRRIKAAKAVANHPRVGHMLQADEISLSVIDTIADSLGSSDEASLLEAVKGKTQAEAERLVLRFTPPRAEKLYDYVKPVALSARENERQPALPLDENREETATEPQFFRSGSSYENDRELEELLHRVAFTANESCMKKLKRAMALMSSNVKGRAKLAQVVERALDAYLDKHCPERRLARRRARSAGAAESSAAKDVSRVTDDIKALADEICCNTSKIEPSEPQRKTTKRRRKIKRNIYDLVLERDGFQCTFVSPEGVRCCGEGFIEVDHIIPVAQGGTDTMDNLRTVCRAHNIWLAEFTLGKDWMDRYRLNQSAPPTPTT